MRRKKSISKIGEKIESILNRKEIELIAKEVGFVCRKSNLMGSDFLYLNIQGIGSCGFSSLTELCIQLKKDYEITISKQGLDERYHNKSSEFLKTIVMKILSARLGMSLDLTRLGIFQGIYLRDATSSQIPSCFSDLFKGSGGSASKAGLKIELSYDIKGDKIDIEFRDGASSDSTSKDVEFEQDGLYLQDLGYFKLKRFKKIISSNAYFISRYKYPTNIYDHAGGKRAEKQKDKQITLKTLTKRMKVNEIRVQNIYLGMYERVPVRLLIQKLPKKVADKRKRKLREEARRKRYSLSEDRIKLCEYTLLISNIEAEVLTNEQIIQTYGIRWQIEIMFKCWKSVLKFGIIHPMKSERFLSMLYGHMIWIVLVTKITSWFRNICWMIYRIQISELKLFKLMRIYHNDFLKIISNKDKKDGDLEDFVLNILDTAFIFAEKEQKKGNPNRLFSIS